MKNRHASWVAFVLLLTGCAGSAETAPTEEQRCPADIQIPAVGRARPPAPDGEWLRGGPFTAEEERSPRAVVIWSVTCGPCLGSMSALHAAAAEFPVVTILARERGMAAGEQRRFIAGIGPELRLRVVFDGADEPLAKAWFDGYAGEHAYPTAFILDRDGRLAWIGHPAGVMIEALRWVAGPDYTPEEARRRKIAEWELELRTAGLWRDFWNLEAEGKFEEAIAFSRKLDAIGGDAALGAAVRRMQLLVEHPEAAGGVEGVLRMVREDVARSPDDEYLALRTLPLAVLTEGVSPEGLESLRPEIERLHARVGEREMPLVLSLAKIRASQGDPAAARALLEGMRKYMIDPGQAVWLDGQFTRFGLAGAPGEQPPARPAAFR